MRYLLRPLSLGKPVLVYFKCFCGRISPKTRLYACFSAAVSHLTLGRVVFHYLPRPFNLGSLPSLSQSVFGPPSVPRTRWFRELPTTSDSYGIANVLRIVKL